MTPTSQIFLDQMSILKRFLIMGYWMNLPLSFLKINNSIRIINHMTKYKKTSRSLVSTVN